jgi:hypothetical protein
MTYYAITCANGPISVRIDADSPTEAAEKFAEIAGNPIDDCRTDAEDDLAIDGDGMTSTEFDEALTDAGAEFLMPLTDGNSSSDWYLWET